jgi:uncharacterized SAM-binding protein YcdF (DUF218 family)
MRIWQHILFRLGAVAAAFLVFGFLVFASLTTRVTTGPSAEAVRDADAIVALTGGTQRIGVAGQLLKQGKANRLLISGVNRVVSRQELRKLLQIDQKLFDCCVDVGYSAQNTRGNAVETRKWAQKHRFKSIIVVTASYHMPRSLTELGSLMPATDLVAYPVLPERFRKSPWWLDHENVMLLGAEYLKYLPSAAQFGIGRMLETPRSANRDSAVSKAVAIQ